MTEHDAKLSARYRELASEEPSAVIDEAIRAAARRAVASRRASFQSRWAAPISIAAVLVLAVGVTLRMQLEQPGVEVPTVDSAAPSASLADRAPPPAAPAPSVAEADTQAKRMAPESKPQPEPKSKLESQDFLRQKKDELRRDESFARQTAEAPAPEQKPVPTPFPASTAGSVSTTAPASPAALAAPAAAAAPAPAPVPAPSTVTGLSKEEASEAVAPQLVAKAREAESGVSSDKLAADKVNANVAAPGRAGPATSATAPPPAKAALGAMRESQAAGERAATPEKELERIAELRRTGRNAEADEALTRFKREHPDYRIADEIWEKVRPR